MTPDEMKSLRRDLGLTQSELADAFRLSEKGGKHSVREWETGTREPSGPVSLLYELIRDFANVRKRLLSRAPLPQIAQRIGRD